MNDVLIDKEILEDLLEQHISMMGHTSTVAYMAQQALSRPAPAVQVPEVMTQIEQFGQALCGYARSGDQSQMDKASRLFDGIAEKLYAAPAATVATEVEHSFGNGEKVVCRGTHGGRPAVFIAPAKMPGAVGEDASRENAPRDRLVAGEIVLTFPTEAQAVTVEAALLNVATEDGAQPAKPMTWDEQMEALGELAEAHPVGGCALPRREPVAQGGGVELACTNPALLGWGDARRVANALIEDGYVMRHELEEAARCIATVNKEKQP